MRAAQVVFRCEPHRHCDISPLWGRGMFIHIVGAIGKSPSQTKLFGQPLYNTNAVQPFVKIVPHLLIL